MRLQFHWKKKKASEDDAQGNSTNNLETGIARKSCLRDVVMRVILKAKGLEKLKGAIEMLHVKAVAKLEVTFIANLARRVQHDPAVRKASIPVQARWDRNPQR